MRPRWTDDSPLTIDGGQTPVPLWFAVGWLMAVAFVAGGFVGLCLGWWRC